MKWKIDLKWCWVAIDKQNSRTFNKFLTENVLTSVNELKQYCIQSVGVCKSSVLERNSVTHCHCERGYRFFPLLWKLYQKLFIVLEVNVNSMLISRKIEITRFIWILTKLAFLQRTKIAYRNWTRLLIFV